MFAKGGLISLVIVLLAGVLGVLHYFPIGSRQLSNAGFNFTAIRPIHTTFASTWIFLASVAIIYRYLQEVNQPVTNSERWRLRLIVVVWGLTGLGIIASLFAGITSGREYMGFHPVFSISIMFGWILFGWSFFRLSWRGFFEKPVYVTMWGSGIILFLYTFTEQHAWLLPQVFADPIVDMRVQWKATGMLVGSFNLLVYGCLYYLASKLVGDDRYAHSKLAYALFGITLLNSFTNYGHHTYHLPQDHLVKWISYVVSMSEIVILAKVIWDIAKTVLEKKKASTATQFFLSASKWWTMGILVTAILISIPPLNSIIHGTYVVTGHAMGAEIGIDSMILFACLAWILSQNLTNTKLLKQAAIGFNISTAALVVWLTVAGTVTGISRYKMLPAPEWITANNPIVFAITGISAAAFLALITFLLSRAAWSREVKPVAELPFVVVKSESVGISLETSDQESVSPD
jgi:nitric oxide reductase subunit B